MQTQKHKQKQKQSTCMKCPFMNTHHRAHTPRHTNTFTLCLCGLSEPAKLSFLLLSEVSQCDPLVFPTCSSHSQTAEEAVSQYKRERTTENRCNTNYSTDTATMSREKATKQVCRTYSNILSP